MSGMETNYDLGYPIVVGASSEFVEFASQFDRPALVLTDADPAVRRVARAAARAMDRAPVVPVPLGERRKRLATVERVVDALAARGVERDALVVGVGGGVASDLFGFACATYMRGIRYAHVATSLVAMVDAAIGAKTGVNLRAGKNLVGSFRDPVGVFCDVAALRTLTGSAMREGMSEIVKAAVIEGGEFFASLEELSGHRLAAWPWEQVVAGAVKVKTMVVADDRLESGRRETLNLGHTFAHAIERASNFRVTHGAAVALGLRAAGLLALQTGRFSRDEHLRVLTLLALFGLPLDTAADPNEVLAAMRHDKKRRGGRLRFTLPRAIGDVEYGVEVPLASVRAVLRRLREPPEPSRARR
ncbi:MAG: 3-dehydroquinate synthase [Candidatus Eremiobacteraeota bacterium]|nr:3-dehydroquinate synthase [Candidatus Eremiobacteraeota bacterium]MBV9264190.1 3-dehydroquinate synthase [Candidatus Eremiobacteraeota bacterium]